MLRRSAAVLLALACLLVAGCGATPGPDQARRISFIEKYPQLKDPQLATLCPSLYPSDFLEHDKHYRYTKLKQPFAPSAQQKADAERAGCTSRGTPPK